jgi:hypothetical protein
VKKELEVYLRCFCLLSNITSFFCQKPYLFSFFRYSNFIVPPAAEACNLGGTKGAFNWSSKTRTAKGCTGNTDGPSSSCRMQDSVFSVTSDSSRFIDWFWSSKTLTAKGCTGRGDRSSSRIPASVFSLTLDPSLIID